jgi:hypothetical protein
MGCRLFGASIRCFNKGMNNLPEIDALIAEAEGQLLNTARLLRGQPHAFLEATKQQFGSEIVEALIDWNEGRISWESCCSRIIGPTHGPHLN